MLTDEFIQQCENLAITWRRKLDMWGYDFLPARLLARRLEVRLVTPYELDLSIEDIEQAISSTGWSAITVLTQPRIIIYHPIASPVQFESNIMHELAHILRNHQPEQLGLISDFRVARKYSKRQEYEADTLGIALQLPRVALQYMRQQRKTIEQIAKDFQINFETVQSRLSE